MSDVSIKIEGVGKKYSVGVQKESSLRSTLGSVLKSSVSKGEEFWALKDVSFEVNRKEVIGIIGKNGAGKSTLLKILSQITKPTKGRIEINGRVASLLEVGTGFHPELTGRENIYLNGTILGMTRKEVKEKFDEIIEFSGVKKFIDTPVKHYSSGMYVRLAFAVAAHLEPEILVIDEVLAVGDAEFQKKCLGKMHDVAEHGRTVLFVSHDMGAVSTLCDRVVVLSAGKVVFQGDTKEGVDYYLQRNNSLAEEELLHRADRVGNGKIRFRNVSFETIDNRPLLSVCSGMDISIKLEFDKADNISEIVFRIQIVDKNGNILTTLNNFHSSRAFKSIEGNSVSCIIKHLPLFDGNYTLNLQALVNFEVADEIESAANLIVEPGNFFSSGKLPNVKQGILLEHEWKN